VTSPARGDARRGGRERTVVPDVEFTSYYGRPVVKAAPWTSDIPAYLFLGGLAAGSSLLAAGADLTGRDSLRRPARVTAAAAMVASFGALVHDLGRPARFVNMLRVAKPTSPMSVGVWLLAGYGPMAGVAAVSELPRIHPAWADRLVRRTARPAGLAAAVAAPAVASYTAVLLADTATPTWHESYRQLPFAFVGSAAAASGGAALIYAHPADAGPARRLAVGGAAVDLAAMHTMEHSLGLAAEPLTAGPAGALLRAGKVLTGLGGAGAALSRRSRALSIASGAALVGGSICTRFGLFHAGQQSAEDPKYTVAPQRQRLDRSPPLGDLGVIAP
jgi:formate-dependent nitrite reductase membrane component NrfD